MSAGTLVRIVDQPAESVAKDEIVVEMVAPANLPHRPRFQQTCRRSDLVQPRPRSGQIDRPTRYQQRSGEDRRQDKERKEN